MSRKTTKVPSHKFDKFRKAFWKSDFDKSKITIEKDQPQNSGFAAENSPTATPPVNTKSVSEACLKAVTVSTSTQPVTQPKRLTEVPTLRITPYAWRKLRYIRGKTQNEVGFFGVTAADDPLLLIDVALVPQEVGPATVEFDGLDIARFWAECDQKGMVPAQYTRIWVHTHPGNSATPSGVDHNTFDRYWGNSDWAIMMVVAQDDSYTIKLRYNVGIPADFAIKLHITYDIDFPATDKTAWDKEYAEKVKTRTYTYTQASSQYHVPVSKWNGRGYGYGYSYWGTEENNYESAFTKNRLCFADIWTQISEEDRRTFCQLMSVSSDLNEIKRFFTYLDSGMESGISIYESKPSRPTIVTYVRTIPLKSVEEIIKKKKLETVVTPKKESNAFGTDSEYENYDSVYLDTSRTEVETAMPSTKIGFESTVVGLPDPFLKE